MYCTLKHRPLSCECAFAGSSMAVENSVPSFRMMSGGRPSGPRRIPDAGTPCVRALGMPGFTDAHTLKVTAADW